MFNSFYLIKSKHSKQKQLKIIYINNYKEYYPEFSGNNTFAASEILAANLFLVSLIIRDW